MGTVTVASIASPVPRRLRSPSWFDLRLLLGIVLVIGSVAAGAFVVARAESTRTQVVAARDLAAGTVLIAGDLHIARMKLGRTGDGYVSASADAVGRALTRPLAAGELIARSSIAPPASTDTTVPISVRPENAPVLQRGQRIAVWVSTAYCQAVLVLGDVTVQAVRTAGSGLSASSAEGVVVRVSNNLAARVFSALGLEGAVIRIGVLGGNPDAKANDVLPSLKSCSRAASTP